LRLENNTSNTNLNNKEYKTMIFLITDENKYRKSQNNPDGSLKSFF
jgi:hypothetical protein